MFSLEFCTVFIAALCCHMVLVGWPISSWFFPSFQWSTLRSTSNSLLAGLLPLFSKSTPPSSGDSVAVTMASSGASNSLPNKITVTVAHALHHSLLTFVSTLRADFVQPLVSSAAPLPPSILSVVSSSAMVAASSLASTSGRLRLPPFVSMFTTIFTIKGSC